MSFFKSVDAKTAFRLGSICSISYLAVYISRNILSAAAPFVAAFINNKFFKENIYNTLLFSFSTSATAFLLLFFVNNPLINLIIIFIAIFTSKLADAMLWSIYCPSLKTTGMVSTATGALDFFSYFGAAISTYVFGDIATKIGWGKLILIWFAIEFIGIFFSFTPKKKAI